jgi:hypothetical protein
MVSKENDENIKYCGNQRYSPRSHPYWRACIAFNGETKFWPKLFEILYNGGLNKNHGYKFEEIDLMPNLILYVNLALSESMSCSNYLFGIYK